MKISFPQKSNFSKTKNYYYAIILYLFSPLLLLYAFFKVKQKPSSPTQWRTGLILGPTHIGDLLFFTSSLHILTEKFPDCKWYCVTEGYSSQALLNNPHIAGIIHAKSTKELFDKKSKAYNEVKALKPDAAIIMMRNNYFSFLLAAINLGIGNRVGYGDKGMEYLLTNLVPAPPTKMPHSAYYRRIVEHLCDCVDTTELRPQVFPAQSDEGLAETFINATYSQPKAPLVVICASGKTTNSNWTVEYYQQFVTLILQNFGANVLLCGSKADGEILTSIANNQPENVKVAAGNLGLLQLACIMKRSFFVFSPDSGPRHIANAVKTPVYYIPNLSDNTVEIGVYCERETSLIPGKSLLSDEEARLLTSQLTPESVIETIKQTIG